MRRTKIIVAILIFFAVIIFVLVKVTDHNNRIGVERIINDAGRNGEPIFLARYINLTGSKLYGVYSIDNEVAGINCTSLNKFFTDDGTLYQVEWAGDGNTQYVGTDYMIPGWPLKVGRFPEMIIRDANLPSFEVEEIADTDDLLDEDISPNGRYRSRMFETHLEIVDFTTGDIFEMELDSSAPWNSEDFPDVDSYFTSISNDGKYMLLRAHIGNQKNYLPVWKFSVESGEWVLLGEFYTGIYERLDRISEGGRFAAIVEADREMISIVRVIDTETGEDVLNIPGAEYPQFGRRWFCFLVTHRNEFAEIRAYDMENDWGEYSIPLRDDSFFASASENQLTFPFPIAMYEPPPDGLGGMNENYSPAE